MFPVFTDTDSLCYQIQTDDVYEDMAKNLQHYDTSAYLKTHPLYSPINAKIIGKFKDETNSVPPEEFVGLRAKISNPFPPRKVMFSSTKLDNVIDATHYTTFATLKRPRIRRYFAARGAENLREKNFPR